MTLRERQQSHITNYLKTSGISRSLNANLKQEEHIRSEFTSAI